MTCWPEIVSQFLVDGPVQVCLWIHRRVVQTSRVDARADFGSQVRFQVFQLSLRADRANDVQPLVDGWVLHHPRLAGCRTPGRCAGNGWDRAEHGWMSLRLAAGTPLEPKLLRRRGLCYRDS